MSLSSNELMKFLGEREVESVVKQCEFKMRANSKTNDSFTQDDRCEKEVRS